MTTYCEKIMLVSLDEMSGLYPESNFCVFDKGFIIQKDSNSLVYFDNDGHFQKELKFDVIGDFSTFRNKRLYVLAFDRIEMYDLDELKHEGTLPLPDSSFTYCKVGGTYEDVVAVFAFRGGKVYSGDYDTVQKTLYFPVEGNIKGSNDSLKKVLGKSGFFYNGDESYFYYSNTGTVYQMADFYFLSYVWDFKKKKEVHVTVSNVQKMTNKLFMNLETSMGDYCSIITINDDGYPHSSALYSSSKTPYFPLGIIYNKTNYYLCNSMDIDKYVSRNLLDSEENNRFDTLKSHSNNIMIKYHLK